MPRNSWSGWPSEGSQPAHGTRPTPAPTTLAELSEVGGEGPKACPPGTVIDLCGRELGGPLPGGRTDLVICVLGLVLRNGTLVLRSRLMVSGRDSGRVILLLRGRRLLLHSQLLLLLLLLHGQLLLECLLLLNVKSVLPLLLLIILL